MANLVLGLPESGLRIASLPGKKRCFQSAHGLESSAESSVSCDACFCKPSKGRAKNFQLRCRRHSHTHFFLVRTKIGAPWPIFRRRADPGQSHQMPSMSKSKLLGVLRGVTGSKRGKPFRRSASVGLPLPRLAGEGAPAGAGEGVIIRRSHKNHAACRRSVRRFFPGPTGLPSPAGRGRGRPRASRAERPCLPSCLHLILFGSGQTGLGCVDIYAAGGRSCSSPE